MATFKDTKDRTWTIRLDPVLIREVEEKHDIQLVNLNRDPLLKVRSDPLTLVAVIHVLCQEQIDQQSLTDDDFVRGLPFPPDPMEEALTQAIIDFFPTGQASHVTEVLAKYSEMATTTNALSVAKMDQVLKDPDTKKRLNTKASQEIEDELERLFPINSRRHT